MAENARSGFVWEQFMKNDVAQTEWPAAGFHDVPPSEAFARQDSLCRMVYPVIVLQECAEQLRLTFNSIRASAWG